MDPQGLEAGTQMGVAANTKIARTAADVGCHCYAHAFIEALDIPAGTGDNPAAFMSQDHWGRLGYTRIPIVKHANIGSADKGPFDLQQNFSVIDPGQIGFTNPQILLSVKGRRSHSIAVHNPPNQMSNTDSITMD
jgi:hypothetical protein